MKTLQHKSNYTSDEVVVDKVVNGETALFEVLIRRYNPLLYKIARSYGFNHHDAEDLMQESHFTAFTNLKTFRKEASYKTWLTKIHLHRCFHEINDGRFMHEELFGDTITEQTLIMQANPDNQDTEKRILNRELAKVLEESLQQIPLAYRSVFVLREIEGFNVMETAGLLEITPVNVKVRLNRAKSMLQKQLEKFYSTAELYEFHLMYCDKIVKNVFKRIATTNER